MRPTRWLAVLFVAAFAAAVPAFAQDVIAVSKSNPSGVTIPGTNITYTVTVTNPSSPLTDAANVVLTDNVPLQTTFVSAVQNSGPAFSCTTPAVGAATGAISCTIGTFPAGLPAGAVFTFTFHIAPIASGTIFNTATVTTTTSDSSPADNTATAGNGVTPQADVGVTKTGPATIAAGANITYSIVVTNAGPSDSQNVRLSDNLTPTARFVSFSQLSGPAFPCAFLPTVGASGLIDCTAPTMPAGTSATFQLIEQVPPSAMFTWQNTAIVTPGTPEGPGGGLLNDISTSTATITTSYDLGVTKSGPLTATVGQPVTYTITVRNDGPSDTPNFTMDDTLPSSLTFVSVSAPVGVTCFGPPVGSSGLVRCLAAPYPTGSSTTIQLVARVASSVANGTSVSNTATVFGITGPNISDPNPFNDSSTTTMTVTRMTDLTVIKTANASTVNPGGNITYTVTINNSGPSDAASVVLDDVVPTGTTFASESQSSGPTFACTNPLIGATGTIHCTIASLAAGATAQFSFVVNNNTSNLGGTVISNTATASTTSPESTLANNSSSATVTVTAAGLAVTKSASPNPVQAGTNITYTVTVSNVGTVGAHDVSMTDAVPANTTFVSNTQTAGPSFACTNPAVGGTGTVSCTNALFAAGASATFSIVVRVNPTTANGTTITNTANASVSDTDPNLANNTATTNTSVAVTSDVVVTKSGPATVGPGGNITYTVTISDGGTSDAQGVTLTDTLPPGTTFVSETQTSGPAFACSNPAVGGTGTISCTISTLGAGASATFSIVLAATAGVGTTITNTASGSSTSADANPANNSSSASTTVAGPDLSVTKSDSPDPVTAGNNITYTVTVMNNGTAGANNVSLVDAVPANTTFVSDMQTAGPSFACSNPGVGGSGTITCTNALLGPASSATFQIVVQVVPGTPASTVITNTATASTTDSEPNTTNNSATATTTVSATPVADLIVSKSDAPDPVSAGANITYTITVTNSGSAAAANVSLTDSVPANTTFVSFSAPGGWTTSTPVAGGTGTVTASNASLAASMSATFTLVVAVGAGVPGGTIISNTATVATTSSETTVANNSATATTTVAAASADVSLSKMAVTASGQITYTIRATNIGPVAATSVIVSDTLPSGTTLVSATPSQGTCSGTTTVTCPLGSIAGGSFATITIVVTAPSVPGGVTNTATVSAANDSNPANDSASATVTVSANIPTLSPLVFALLLAALAAIALRRLNP